MKPLRARLIARFSIASIALMGTVAVGQNSDWNQLIDTGDAAMAKHQYSEAERIYHDAVNMAEKHWKKDARISASLLKLAEACDAQSKREDAESFATQSVAALEEALKAHKPKNASDELQQVEVSTATIDKAGDIFAADQKYADAEAMYAKVIATREKYAEEKPHSKSDTNKDFYKFMAQTLSQAGDKLADADDKLASLYRTERKFQDAEALYRKSEALREKAFGASSPQVAKSLNDLAAIYAQQGQYDQAEPLYKHVISILDISAYKEQPQMATALENYALVLKRTGREDEAKELLERANEIRAKSATPPH